MQKERRQEPRCLIDAPLFCSLHNEDGRSVTCIINDISLHGAMLIFPPDDQDLLPVGQQVTFAEVPEELDPILRNMCATIAWSKGKICGLHFAHSLQLTEENLIAIVASIENALGPDLYEEGKNIAMDFDEEEKF